MSWIIVILFMFANFILFPYSVYLLLDKFLQFPKEKSLYFLTISASLSLPLLSLILNYLLILASGRSNTFYVAVVVFLYALPIIFRKERIFAFYDAFVELKKQIRDFSKFQIIIAVIFLGLSVSFFYLSMIMPLAANDPLLYFQIARHIFDEKNILIYPFFEPYLTGYYGPSWHPPAYHGLLVWSFIFQGNSVYTILGRLYAPFFAVVSCMLLYGTIAPKNRSIALVCLCLFLGTPLYYSHVTIAHIDSFRICCYLASVCWSIYFIQNVSFRNAVVLGLFTGLAMRAHGFSLIILPAILTGTFFLMNEKIRKKVLLSGLICVIALMICGFDYGRNMVLNKSFVPGTEEKFSVYMLEKIDYENFIKISRNIEGLHKKINHGLLKGFTNLKTYGLTYWFMLGGLLVLIYKRERDEMTAAFGFQIIFFYGLVAVTLILGSFNLIKNVRYYLTIQPFVVYFASIFIVAILPKEHQ